MSEFLEVFWARTHNLKNINVKIPKNKMTVITWVSWSGKSSLAFNTIYSVWQQKYLESLSSYARMFVGWMMEEAEVDEIKWLSPTISIDQKTTSKNPRSTVWTITEIYDYYKLLYLNIWSRKCVKCWTIVKKDSLDDVIKYLSTFSKETKFVIKFPLKKSFSNFEEFKKEILELGFIRFSFDWKIYSINDNLDFWTLDKVDKVDIIVDRLLTKDYTDRESSDTKRLKDSLELSFKLWKWFLKTEVFTENYNEERQFSNIFVCSNCWHIPEELSISSFSFNSHSWACPHCHWLWIQTVFLEEKITNPNLTLAEWAIIVPWFWWEYFSSMISCVSEYAKVNINKKYSELTKKEKEIILYWTGNHIYKVTYKNESWVMNTYNSKFEWVINTLTRRYFDSWAEKWHYDDFITEVDCLECKWKRLKKEALNVYLKDLDIWDLSNLSVTKSLEFLRSFELSISEEKIVKKVLKNAIERLEFLSGVWLDYMTISRKAWTLSGWEAQRIRLATQIWTKLEWIIYVLDEPSIWLHPRDNNMLINNLKKLRDIWNTLIIVEHDEDIMRESDYIIDIWPWAWIHWWNIIAEWTVDEIIANKNSITWAYLESNLFRKIKKGFRPSYKDLKSNWKVLSIVWARQNNLKNVSVDIPLSTMTVVTWVSWSGKSSLVNDIIWNYLLNKLNKANRQVWLVDSITWLDRLDKAVIIDQSPIWKTPRSNPATYTWVFTYIRDVFASTTESQVRWYGPWRFSFNTKHWRCNECDWDWTKKIEMHFLPPVYVECESCHGKRFNNETLQIKYKWKSIADVLDMTIEESIDFFENHPKIIKILKTIDKVWLSYIKLWQSSTTLSGWEAQRIKLSTELSKRSTWWTFYILDEPTTWLHFQDVDRLLKILHSLVDKWNTVLVIEHNMDVILNADHIIDIWPEWWYKWWNLVCFWTVEEVSNNKESFTAEAIRKYLKKS